MPYTARTTLTRAIARTLTAWVFGIGVTASAQDTAQLQKMFDAGRYQQVVEAVPADSSPQAVYTAAQSHQKLGASDRALEMYTQLVALPEDDAWHFVGLSGQQLVEGNNDSAVDSARQAVELAGDLPEAHFQLGLAQARQENWEAAAAEFDRVIELNPAHAYAHYYGGLMHYRANRPDRMAVRFEQFLKLAPEAPERPEVLQIMRTIRGR